MLLTACTDYDALLPTKAEELSQAERLANADSLFLNLRIVSNSHITRATEVGTDKENAVYDGILCIFEGPDAATATLRSAVAIDQLISNPYEPRTVAAGTATSINITQRLQNTHSYADYVGVAVLLNTTRSGFYVKDSKLFYRTTTVNATTGEVTYSSTDLTGQTYSAVINHDIENVGSTDRHVGLFMKSTAMVAATALYDTPEQAAAGSATYNEITVARVAAKVTVHSGLSSGDDITNITLNGSSTTHAKFHTMRWMLTPAPGYADEDFTDWHQHALKSDDAIYVKPGTSSVVVELQVKDGSFLIDEAYRYQNGNDIRFYTSTKPLVEFFKEGWTDTFHYHYPKIGGRTAAEVFRHPAFYINDDGSVNLTLTNDSFTGTGEQDDLATLANVLKGFLSGYRDAKMYYTFSIGNLASNNSYTLTFDNSSISGIGRPTPTPAP